MYELYSGIGATRRMSGSRQSQSIPSSISRSQIERRLSCMRIESCAPRCSGIARSEDSEPSTRPSHQAEIPSSRSAICSSCEAAPCRPQRKSPAKLAVPPSPESTDCSAAIPRRPPSGRNQAPSGNAWPRHAPTIRQIAAGRIASVPFVNKASAHASWAAVQILVVTPDREIDIPVVQPQQERFPRHARDRMPPRIPVHARPA